MSEDLSSPIILFKVTEVVKKLFRFSWGNRRLWVFIEVVVPNLKKEGPKGAPNP